MFICGHKVGTDYVFKVNVCYRYIECSNGTQDINTINCVFNVNTWLVACEHIVWIENFVNVNTKNNG